MSRRRVHQLKTLTEYFQMQAAGLKPFEIRNNDRDFQVGDELELIEIQVISRGVYHFTGAVLRVEVTCIVEFLQKKGVVVMGTKILPWDSE